MAGYPEHRGPNHPSPQHLEKQEERDLRPSLGPGMWRRWPGSLGGRWPVSCSCQTVYPEFIKVSPLRLGALSAAPTLLPRPLRCRRVGAVLGLEGGSGSCKPFVKDCRGLSKMLRSIKGSVAIWNMY